MCFYIFSYLVGIPERNAVQRHHAGLAEGAGGPWTLPRPLEAELADEDEVVLHLAGAFAELRASTISTWVHFVRVQFIWG